jgi:hypothetical protein
LLIDRLLDDRSIKYVWSRPLDRGCVLLQRKILGTGKIVFVEVAVYYPLQFLVAKIFAEIGKILTPENRFLGRVMP